MRELAEDRGRGEPRRPASARSPTRSWPSGAKIRLIDLWIQALNEASDDPVIAKALRGQIREVHAFFAGLIADGQARGVVIADRDARAEAWIFVAGGLLATIDHRLGGLLGGDLERVRRERRRWMHAYRRATTTTDPDTRKSPGCGTRGSPWSGGAPVRALPESDGSAAQTSDPDLRALRRSPCTSTWRRLRCKVVALYEARTRSVKYLGQVIVERYTSPAMVLFMPLLGMSERGHCDRVKCSARLCVPDGSPPAHDEPSRPAQPAPARSRPPARRAAAAAARRRRA